MLDKLPLNTKDSVISKGLADYKAQIQDKVNSFLPSFNQKMNGSGFIDRFKNLLPMDKLNSLTQMSKDQITKNASNLVGQPG